MAGTATAGTDYVTKSQLLTFAPGVTQQTFSVVINGDRTVEPNNLTNETFSVLLSGATGASISTFTATVTILNDD